MFTSLWKWLKQGCDVCFISLGDVLFPQVCEVCGESLIKGEKYLCTTCLADFPFADIAYAAGEKVLVKFEEPWRPVQLYSLFYYNKFSKYKNLIYLIKYHSYQELGRYLGQMLGQQMVNSCQADCIVPIPLHRKRERQRGFNQAYEIARGIQEVLGIEIINDVVFRIHNNVSQTGKNAAERVQNVENIFELRQPQKIKDRHVLLVDDVITTGATIGSCLRILAKAGGVTFTLGCLAQTV